jgi:hypothetical protein
VNDEVNDKVDDAGMAVPTGKVNGAEDAGAAGDGIRGRGVGTRGSL